MDFSSTEKHDLIKAWLVISVAVAIAGLGGWSLPLPLMIRAVVIYALTVGVALLAHEVLGHKLVAQKYGLFAEFRADDLLLTFSVVLSFLGVAFIAPGAVVISGITEIGRYGRIAAAGPAVNIILAFIFGALHRFGIVFVIEGVDLVLLSYGINAWFALFNMLPIGLWDGAKVYNWDRRVWTLLTAAAVLLFLEVV